MIYLDLLAIAAIAVFIIDISGVIDEVEGYIRRKYNLPLFKIPKPFSCSLCTTFWCGIIYLLLYNKLCALNILYVCVLAMFTPIILNLLESMRDIINEIITKVTNKILN